jgi:hypothetical protein
MGVSGFSHAVTYVSETCLEQISPTQFSSCDTNLCIPVESCAAHPRMSPIYPMVIHDPSRERKHDSDNRYS